MSRPLDPSREGDAPRMSGFAMTNPLMDAIEEYRVRNSTGEKKLGMSQACRQLLWLGIASERVERAQLEKK